MALSTEDKIRMTREAVEWYHRLEADDSDAIEDQFAIWLRQSPHHLPSFLKQAHIEEAMRHIRAERVARAKEQARVAGVVRIGWRPVAIAATVLILIAAPLTILWAWRTAPLITHLTNATARAVTLPDGSSALLNPDSRLTARDLAGFTEIELISGGAQFRVHHRERAQRLWQRFRVLAGKAVITATGTEFNVLRTDELISVYVEEGGVVVESHAPASSAVRKTRLVKGQSADVSATGVIGNIQSARPERAAGGVSINVSLATLAADINRRNRSPRIFVEGTARQKLFRQPEGLDDPEAWVAALSTYSDLKIERRGSQVFIRGARDEP